ncbi:ROK family protein [Phycicoccus sp. CMS6Z-2]|nr:ROK family protein [Phycicoccus flavus]
MAGPAAGVGISQAALRATNLATVTRAVLAAPSPPSRARVAEGTSLTRSTVSRLVDELVAGGVLAEGAPDLPARRGRPGIPLSAGRVAALGMLVNVAGMTARVLDLGGSVLAQASVERDLRGESPDAVLGELLGLADRVRAEVSEGLPLAGARLALPGVVTTGSDVLLVAPNLGWTDVRPADVLTPGALGGLALRLGNEADLAARTVADLAPGRPGPLRDFLYVSGEVGIGGAVVVDGRPLSGRHGWAGEIGHVCVDPRGPSCRCGSTGCLERYVGREELAARAGVAAADVGRLVRQRVAEGDSRAAEAVEHAAWALGVALSSAVTLIDTPAIVLGGHLGQIADLLREPLEAALEQRVLSAHRVRPTVCAHDGSVSSPAATGAAMAELDELLARPDAWLARVTDVDVPGGVAADG